MSFVVSARKYRPQNFDELIGQNHIAQTLKNAIKNDQLAHAFLFSGPRGVGKTTSARILARVLNCENLQDYKACGECSSCKSFAENASFNIFELDAASNNSVEHIRSLNEQVRFQPQQGSYKIYIIDEVHMLSQAAFNAFLKTLEEPPSYAKFILATTEKHKIIPTILSRCQIFDFKRIQIKDIVIQLEDIAKKEGRNFDDDALHLIAQKADGAMRDALSIYDKVVSSVEGDISYSDVAENLNVLDYDYYFRIVDHAIKEDLGSLMLIFDDIIKKGFEPEQFTLGFMEHLRQLLLVKDIKTAELLDTGETLKARYENQAQLASKSFILSSLSVLNQCDINLQRAQNKRLSLEIALSKIAFLNRIVDKKKLFESLNAEMTEEEIPRSNIQEPSALKEVIDLEESKEVLKLPDSPKLSTKQEAEPSKLPTSEKKSPTIPKIEIAQISHKSKSSATPTISSNIDNLIASIANQEAEKRKSTMPFESASIRKLFDDYSATVSSNTLKTALEHTQFDLTEDTVLVLTPVQIYIDYIRQETALIESIHDTYPEIDVKLKFQVSEETFPDYQPPKKPKHLTTKEKYELLISKNPQFESLVKEFKLKISN